MSFTIRGRVIETRHMGLLVVVFALLVTAPRLTLTFIDGTRWQLDGSPTAQTQYGSAGERIFLEVAPQRGNAVFFSYERPHPSTQTLHGGAPVLAGEKWIATKWLRERIFE